MTEGQIIGEEHPDGAAYVDLKAGLVTTNSGEQLPVIRVLDYDEEEEVEAQDYDLHDNLAVVFGPTSCGLAVLAYVGRSFVGQLSGGCCESYAS